MSELGILGRERALIDKLTRALQDSARGHEVTSITRMDRGSTFRVRIFDGRESSGRVARVTVELESVEPYSDVST